MTLFVLSPHLDDAVLSVGAALARRRGARDDVVVVSIFSRTLSPQREDEDRRSLAALGARAVHLGLLDAPLRGLPLTTAALCAEPDAAVVAAVAAAVAEFAVVVGAEDEFWVPLSVGGHVDHRATLRACADRATALYEDRPYARARGAVAAAWRRLDAVVAEGADAAEESADGAIDVDADVDDAVFFCDRVGLVVDVVEQAPRAVRFAGHRWARAALPVDATSRAHRQRAIDLCETERDNLIAPSSSSGWPFDDAAEFVWRRRDA